MSDINALMNRDPLELAKDRPALKEIVEYMRKQRHLFANNVGKPAAKRPVSEKAKAVQGLNLDLKL